VSDFSSPESCDKFQTFQAKSEQRQPNREDEEFQSLKIKPSRLRVIQYKPRKSQNIFCLLNLSDFSSLFICQMSLLDIPILLQKLQLHLYKNYIDKLKKNFTITLSNIPLAICFLIFGKVFSLNFKLGN